MTVTWSTDVDSDGNITMIGKCGEMTIRLFQCHYEPTTIHLNFLTETLFCAKNDTSHITQELKTDVVTLLDNAKIQAKKLNGKVISAMVGVSKHTLMDIFESQGFKLIDWEEGSASFTDDFFTFELE